MRHFFFGFLRVRAYGSEREGNFGLNYSVKSRVYVIKKKKEERKKKEDIVRDLMYGN